RRPAGSPAGASGLLDVLELVIRLEAFAKLFSRTVKTGGLQLDEHGGVGRVLPIPSVDSGERRHEAAVAAICTHLVVLRIAFESALGATVGFAVELVEDFRRAFPGVDETAALLHVVLELHARHGCE